MDPKPFVRPPIVTELDLDVKPDVVQRFRVVMTENATGNETLVPVFILRAKEPGPVVGITAAIHGNELNGIPVIHRLIERLLGMKLLKGTLVAVPIVNIPGYINHQREFQDGADLNRIMPGKPNGSESELYAHRFMERIVRRLNYLIDLHTASFGRVNSLYVRADMNSPTVAEMARKIRPQIILHSPGADGTLRSAAAALGIHAITVEVGDPQTIQRSLVRSARLGVQEVLEYLGLIPNVSDPDGGPPVECERSFWMYTDRGGILTVLPEVTDFVEEGETVAILRNVWGDVVREYKAVQAGVVIGKSSNPAARAGSRIVHMGVVARRPTEATEATDEA